MTFSQTLSGQRNSNAAFSAETLCASPLQGSRPSQAVTVLQSYVIKVQTIPEFLSLAHVSVIV